MKTQVIRAVHGWMCQVDWDWELGEAVGGNTVFASEQDLRKHRKCVGMDEYHQPQEVVVLSADDYEGLLRLSGISPEEVRGSNIGEVFWSKDTA